MKKAWVIYNGHLPGNKFRDFAEWIDQAAAKQGITTEIIKNNHLLSYLSHEENTIKALDQQELPNFIVFADKDIHLAKQLEILGVPVYNSSHAIEVSDNKIATYQQLAKQGLPIPKSIVGPKIFQGVSNIDAESFLAIENYFNFPVVVKEAYGSFGEQVYLIKTMEDLIEKITTLQDKPFIIQEFIESSYGKDIRLNVVGDQVVASMLRTSAEDFRANISSGGTMATYSPTVREKEIAVAATKAIGADFAGVDLLFGPNNDPIICEINSNAHIRNIYDCTNINVADYIIEYILRTLTYK